jgi:hypothetical protein
MTWGEGGRFQMTKYAYEMLQTVLNYDPTTGLLTWKQRDMSLFSGPKPLQTCNSWNKKFAGKEAFICKSNGGYLTSTVFNKRLMAHRVAWCIFHEKDIEDGMQIDHVNGVTSDNRICNLRVCTQAENQRNVEAKRNTLRGAHFCKSSGKWQTAIRLHLGTFNTAEEAAKAYEDAAKKLHGKFYLPNGKRVNVSRAL